MQIMFFSHYYPPEVNAPASRTSEHCRAWVNAGHEVTVVTCAPNHPSGRVYRGYRNRLYQTETVDGVRVVRVWTFLAANEGVVLRTLNYLSYLISAAAVLPWLPRPDVVVSTSPQFFCGLVGIIARSLFKAPWVLEIRDLWPESIVTVGALRKGLMVRLLERLEALAYRSADRIVSVTHSFVPHIVARGSNPGKIAVIKNGADLELFTKFESATGIKTRLGLENRFVAGYVGTHGMAHGLSVVLEAAERLRRDPRIAFLLVGDGAERANLEQIREKQRLDNVVILGQRPKEEMPSLWAAIDASLILLRRQDLFKKVIPSKMFEAMAMRCPIVLGVEGEARALLDEAGAGIAITPESAEELAAAVVRLVENPALAGELGDRGFAYVREQHDRARLATRYLDLLGEVAAGFHCGARVSGNTGHALPG
jgi:glycosyltransferase involved in cell wall biosynthesis